MDIDADVRAGCQMFSSIFWKKNSSLNWKHAILARLVGQPISPQ